MSKDGNALERLKGLMSSHTKEDVLDNSISSDDYVNSIAGDIASKMSFEEVTVDDPTEDKTLEDAMIDDPVVVNIIDDEPSSEASSPVAVEKLDSSSENTESIIEENIPIDVNDTGSDIPFNENEELFNNNTELNQPKPRGKRRGRKSKHEEELIMPKAVEEKVTVKETSKSSNPIYNRLILNMFEELRKRKFKFNGLDEESMEILYNYMQEKL